MFAAEVIADSLAPNGKRLTTMQVTFPRIILAEFNTHRMLSRNSASSRAIPISKMLDAVKYDPFIPERWPKNQKGMQAKEYLGTEDSTEAQAEWLAARDNAVQSVMNLQAIDVHKQIANRILEPWMWTTCVVSATEWNNFFYLRDHKDAQPEIQRIARMMKAAYIASEPEEIGDDDWHLPYVNSKEKRIFNIEYQQGLSVARCGRVSFTAFDGTSDHQADYDIYERMRSSTPIHSSPFEHVATPMAADYRTSNFIGYKQLRETLSGQAGTHVPIKMHYDD